jgi:hypothetical protein
MRSVCLDIGDNARLRFLLTASAHRPRSAPTYSFRASFQDYVYASKIVNWKRIFVYPIWVRGSNAAEAEARHWKPAKDVSAISIPKAPWRKWLVPNDDALPGCAGTVGVGAHTDEPGRLCGSIVEDHILLLRDA